MTGLEVPQLDPHDDVLAAAFRYAAAGWYVAPTRADDPKNPGSILGKRWQTLTTRDPEQLVDWWAGTEYRGLVLHAGRSGAVMFDVDHPDQVPAVLAAALDAAPFQESRPDQPGRGHGVFACPPGRRIGNSVGGLGKGWGEVRGLNGVIAVAPSRHADAAAGAAYRWTQVGPVPVLPAQLADLLPDAGETTDAATDAQVAEFRARCVGAANLRGFEVGPLADFRRAVDAGGSRHESLVEAACWAAREALAGHYPATMALDGLCAEFLARATAQGPGRRGVSAARAEAAGVVAWAVAQAQLTGEAEARERVAQSASRWRERQGIGDFDALTDEPVGGSVPGRPGSVPPVVFAGPGSVPGRPGSVPSSVPGHSTPLPVVPLPVAPPATQVPAELPDGVPDAFELRVREELRALAAREEARRRLTAERTPDRPRFVTLRELLDEPDEQTLYRIDGVLPVGGRAMLAAQYKAGKSTLVGNLVRSLVDGDPFLGRYDVEPLDGPVVILDDELDRRMLRRWLRDQGIRNRDQVVALPLRGAVSSFNLIDPVCRSEWAAELREVGAAFVILDCLRPVLDALGLSEDKDGGRILVAFDELLAEAGVGEALVVHHAGHGGERARGDSRLRDWPDVEWRLVRQDDEPSSPRYFTAYGRDVDIAETGLAFDERTRQLTAGGGTRKDAAADDGWPQLRRYLEATPGASGREVDAFLVGECGMSKRIADSTRKRAVRRGRVTVVEGEKRAMRHFLAVRPDDPFGDLIGDSDESAGPAVSRVSRSVPPVSRNTVSECPSVPIGTRDTHTPVEQLAMCPAEHTSAEAGETGDAA